MILSSTEAPMTSTFCWFISTRSLIVPIFDDQEIYNAASGKTITFIAGGKVFSTLLWRVFVNVLLFPVQASIFAYSAISCGNQIYSAQRTMLFENVKSDIAKANRPKGGVDAMSLLLIRPFEVIYKGTPQSCHGAYRSHRQPILCDSYTHINVWKSWSS